MMLAPGVSTSTSTHIRGQPAGSLNRLSNQSQPVSLWLGYPPNRRLTLIEEVDEDDANVSEITDGKEKDQENT